MSDRRTALYDAPQPCGGDPVVSSPPDLDVIVPAFNEEARLTPTLDSLASHLKQMDLQSSIRVIDNGSSDQTPDLVDAAAVRHGGLSITVEGCSRPGKGRAVAKGIMSSRASLVGFYDADGATPPVAINDAVAHLVDGWPIVIGSRHIAGARFVSDQPLHRRLGGSGFRALTRGLAGNLRVADTQCGFKFFHAGVARHIFGGLRTAGFAFDVEILTRARALGYDVKELPVEWSDRAGSTFSVTRHGVDVTRDLIRLRRQRQGFTPSPGG